MVKQFAFYLQRRSVLNLQFTSIIIGLFYLSLLTFRIPAVSAVISPCPQSSDYPRAEGLISAKSLSGKFFNRPAPSNPTLGNCVIDEDTNPAKFSTFPSYSELKFTYYTQPGATDIFLPPGPLNGGATGKVYLSAPGDITTGTLSYAGVNVVFIEGSLTINQNITNTNLDAWKEGLVFVVKNDIIIGPTVTNIDAFLVSDGLIYTAGTACTKSSTTASPLIINGSLISFNEIDADPIKFCRKSNIPINPPPAEVINHQPKYLVILKGIFAETTRTTTEDSF